MKFILAVVFSLFMGALCSAQDSRVIQLKPEDAIAAKAAYDEMKSAEKKWADIQTNLQRTYKGKGFDVGIEFSSDFKFIVPKQQGITAYIWPNYWPNYCLITPAGGYGQQPVTNGFTFSSTSTCGNCIAIN